MSSQPTLFADDTRLEKISKWVNANYESINPEKSNSHVIPPELNCSHDKIAVTINSTPIKVVKKAKYLGIVVDNKLTFGPLIAHLESKLSRAVDILSKLKHFLLSPLPSKLYYALFHSNLLYGDQFGTIPTKRILVK